MQHSHQTSLCCDLLGGGACRKGGREGKLCKLQGADNAFSLQPASCIPSHSLGRCGRPLPSIADTPCPLCCCCGIQCCIRSCAASVAPSAMVPAQLRQLHPCQLPTPPSCAPLLLQASCRSIAAQPPVEPGAAPHTLPRHCCCCQCATATTAAPTLPTHSHGSSSSCSSGSSGRPAALLTLTETVLEAALHALQVLHAASAGGLAADRLHAPVVCRQAAREHA